MVAALRMYHLVFESCIGTMYSRPSMARTPLEPENIFETGGVRANEC